MTPRSRLARLGWHTRGVVAVCLVFRAATPDPIHAVECRTPSFVGEWMGVFTIVGGKTLPLELRIECDSTGTLVVPRLAMETTVDASTIREIVVAADTIRFVQDSPGWATRFHLHLSAKHDSLLGGATILLSAGEYPPFGGAVRLVRTVDGANDDPSPFAT